MRPGSMAALLAGVLVIAACSSGEGGRAGAGPSPSTAPPTAADPTTVTPTVDPPDSPVTTMAVPTTAAATTAAPTTTAPTTAAATTTLPPPVVTPIAVCVDRAIGASWFAYENAGDRPVAVVLGSGNRVDGADPAQGNPLPPTVFAPGRVSPALVVLGTATWTLRGPDGVERAASSADAPDCNDVLRTPSTQDDRAPSVSLSWSLPADPVTAPGQAVLTATVDGLPEVSTCAPGLEPQPPLVWFDPTVSTPLTVGRTMSLPVPLAVVPDPATGDAGEAVGFVLRAWFVDRCAGAGTVNRAWPAGPAGLTGLPVVACARLRDGQVLACEPNDPANPFDRGVRGGLLARSATVPLG